MTTSDLIDGTLNDWPVSLLVQYTRGGKAAGAHCAPYAGAGDEESPLSIVDLCHDITDACEGLGFEAALCKAREFGFTPDVEAML